MYTVLICCSITFLSLPITCHTFNKAQCMLHSTDETWAVKLCLLWVLQYLINFNNFTGFTLQDFCPPGKHCVTFHVSFMTVALWAQRIYKRCRSPCQICKNLKLRSCCVYFITFFHVLLRLCNRLLCAFSCCATIYMGFRTKPTIFEGALKQDGFKYSIFIVICVYLAFLTLHYFSSCTVCMNREDMSVMALNCKRPQFCTQV